MNGYIKLLRKIQSHWIWQDEKKLKWWLSILLNVNHAPQKFPVGDELFVCEAGQSFRSIEQWTSMFCCSKKSTVKFFDLLKKDEMISCKIVGSGNRRKHLLTVINWKEYQQEETELYPPRKPEYSANGNPNVTPNNNDKNDKNIIPSLQEVIIYCDERKNLVDPEVWFNFYSSKGWMIGKNKMKDWRAAIRTWEKNKQQNGTKENFRTDARQYSVASNVRVIDASKD